MWDLIVSVPDHCLSFYFASAYKSRMIVQNIMAAFRKTAIFPFNPDIVLSQINVCSTVSSNAEPTNRKERTDTRGVKVLFSEKVKKVESAITEKKVPARKSVIPPEGAAITEEQFVEEALKERSKPLKKTSNKTIEKSVAKENIKSKLKETVKKGKGPLPGSHRGKRPVKSRKRKGQRNEDFQFDDEDEMFEDRVPCSICGQRYAPNAPKNALVIFDGGRCDICLGWVHLKYCTPVQSLSGSDEFVCSKCQ